jgi:2-oxoglutarate dehydrogenase E2 component (dihydrolipoamide succinyltransferase)/2-oxoisovalerate dehydrogenase E2 component (dihydrolipoyl transacylase)
MPQLGESIAEGTIIKWLVPPGGRVERDQPLLEVETDKVSLEVPSPTSGFLTEVLVAEGQKVPVGTLIARLEGEIRNAEVVNRVGGVVVRHLESGEVLDRYSPAVRQLAREHGVDLEAITGTGAGGRVTKKDVLAFVARQGMPTASPSSAAAAEEIIPLTAMRKTIAERMLKSRQTSAHVTTFFEADFSEVVRFRDKSARDGHSLTYLPFIVSAVARTLKEVPVLNSSWSEHGIVLKKEIHLGIAVALEEGLLVPVIRHADRKGLTVLAQEVADLAERARTKRLNPEEVQGGTFTITNHGGFGSLFSAPIIHQPQIAILGAGAVQKRPVVINDAIAIRPMSYLSLSFDHRVIDGATADRFMSKVKSLLEQSQWETLL